jgi:hypothetical protein
LRRNADAPAFGALSAIQPSPAPIRFSGGTMQLSNVTCAVSLSAGRACLQPVRAVARCGGHDERAHAFACVLVRDRDDDGTSPFLPLVMNCLTLMT